MRRRDLPPELAQVVRGGNIARATAGEYAFAALLWFVLSVLIISAWALLFEACSLTLPAHRGANFCPRPVGQAELMEQQVRNRELAAILASVKSDFVNRAPCEIPQP